MSAYTLKQLRTDGLPLAFGYLLPVVAGQTTITYGQIAAMLQRDLALEGRVFSTHIGGVAGCLMDRIHDVDPDVPLINVLVVNVDTWGPGGGADEYLRKWFGHQGKLSKARKTELVAKAAREVYAYSKWDAVFRKVFRSEPPSSDPSTLIAGTERDGLAPPSGRQSFGGLAESDEHKALKNYVLKHPAAIGASARPSKSHIELRLQSGDEVDVFFEGASRVDLVEVKSIRSSEPDFLRGVYQCIKYRAVFCAQRLSTTPDMNVIATLVTEEQPPSYITDLARQHAVRIKVVRVNRRR